MLAFPALDTIRSPAAFFGVDIVIVIIGVPVLKLLFGVQTGEQIGNRNLFRAAIGAIPAGRTWDQTLRSENFPYFHDGLLLLFGKGMEVFHIADIVQHHFHAPHTGKHHHDSFKTSGKADGVACVAAAVEIVENLLRRFREIDQTAALHRFHDDHRLAKFAADLIALPTLHGGVLIVHIVELNLHHFNLRILGQNLLQYCRFVVEGNTEVLDLSFLLEFQCCFIRLALLEFCVNFGALGVHKVEVKVIHAAGGELTVKQRSNLLLAVEEMGGELIGQNISVPGMALYQTLPQGRFTFSTQIAMCRIKIVEAVFQKGMLYSNILLKLYLKSLKYGGTLQLDENIPYTAQMIATITRQQVGTVERALQIFMKLGLVEPLDNGALYMSNIELFIGQSSTEGERKRRARMKISEQKRLSGQVSEAKADICPPEIEIKKEIDIEIEKERESEPGRAAPAAYGRYKNVILTDTELSELQAELPDKWEYYIDRLSGYIASTGKKYKNHAATIRRWAADDTAKAAPKKGIPDYSYKEGESL